MTILLTILLTLSILLEGTTTALPLTLICLTCFTVFKRDTTVFPFAFAAGLFIDVFRLQPIGGTSLFYICFLLLILLYKKKYEIYSAPFVLIATFLGSFFFLQIFGYDNTVILSIVSAFAGLLLFLFLGMFIKDTSTAHEIGEWKYGKHKPI